MPKGAVRNQVSYIGWLSGEITLQGIKDAGVACPTRRAFIANLRLEHAYTGGGAFDPVDLEKGFGNEFVCVLREGRQQEVRAAVRRQRAVRQADPLLTS